MQFVPLVNPLMADIEMLHEEANRQIEFWKNLKEKLELIYDDDPQVNVEFLTFCYDKVYDFIMYDNKKQIELRMLGKQQFRPGKTQELCRELYYFLLGYMNDKTGEYVDLLENNNNRQILEVYAELWTKYKKVHKRVQFVFKYLDRCFVATERENPNFRGILETYEFAILQWKTKIFLIYQNVLIDEVLRFLKVEREGRTINEKLVGIVTRSFVELGIADKSTTTYNQFEKAFLESTESFYKEKSRKLMIELNTAKTLTFEEYMFQVHMVFANETDRVENYFDKSSIPKVLKICEECLVGDHMPVFVRGFEEFLEFSYFDKMDQFYDLIKRFPSEMGSFTAIFKKYVQKEGENAVAALDNVVKVDLKTYIEKIIAISEKYENQIKNNMENNEAFLIVLEEAMKVFVNENAVTHASTYEDINGELLARYCDKLLSKDSEFKYSPSELKVKLYHAWRIFKVLNDKDGFQKFYENITARRLIFKLTVSEEQEKFMVMKLRDSFGEQDSKSLREILENLKVSHDVNKHFMDTMRGENDTKILKSFSVAVLPERSWPFPSASLYAVSKQFIEKLPPVLEYSCEKFYKFYTKKYAGVKQPKERKIEILGRKMQFLHNLGKGELYAEFLGKTYILQVGAFQMVVLMQFNDKNKFTFEDLKKRAGISNAPDNFLMETISKLFEARILTCDGNFHKLSNSTKIKLNIDFKDPRNHINLDHMVDAENEINRKELLKHLDNDREILTQCAIARVMKRNKRLHRTDLTKEVITECSKRFKPEPNMIKRSLELSVMKDIIEVDKTDKDFYLYLE